MAYFNHAFQMCFLGTHASQQVTYAGGAGTALVKAGVDEGFITSSPLTNGGSVQIGTWDLQKYGLGPGTYGFFYPSDSPENAYRLATESDFSQGGKCCPLILAGAALQSSDKIGPFHGGYQESVKSKVINPKYVHRIWYQAACEPRQTIISIGTTPYTNGSGPVATLTLTNGGSGYSSTTYPTIATTGTGTGLTVTVSVNAGVITNVTIVNRGAGYKPGDTVLINRGAGSNAVLTISTVTSAVSDATCSKDFLCGETYFLRIDVLGSPALRFVNHPLYWTLDAYTGCCVDPEAAPAPVDSTLVMIEWAKQIMDRPLLKDFILPIVYDEQNGYAWYPPSMVGKTIDGHVVTTGETWDDYVSPGHTANKTAGLRLLGAYVDTTFGNCSFWMTDHVEVMPIQIYASLVDMKGEPCEFEKLCVYTECPGYQGNGIGENALRDLILSESYLQNWVNPDPRIREVTLGNDILNALNRASRYGRYYIQHSVPRWSNPTSTYDNDQYVLEIIVARRSASFESFINTWLSNCPNCVSLNVSDGACDDCERPSTYVPGRN